MLANTLLLQPLTQTRNSRTRRLPHRRILIVQSRDDERPHILHVRRHELAATLNCDTEREDGAASVGGVAGRHVLVDEGAERWEDLLGRERRCEDVDDAESGLPTKMQCQSTMSDERWLVETDHLRGMAHRHRYPLVHSQP